MATAGGAGTDTASKVVGRFRSVVPQLTGTNYKGQHGKIGVLGGCREYTGAPYFAAAAASRVGADLMYVFCTESASTVIKGYSPDLIVMPLLPEHSVFGEPLTPSEQARMAERSAALIAPWVSRLSCLVVGPGLGDDPAMTVAARLVMWAARDAGIPLVVDGSGINLVVADPSLVMGYARCLLTPNIAELGRIAAAVGVPLEGPIGAGWQRHAVEIAAAFRGPVLVSKGPVDIITDGTASSTITIDAPAALKRSGGQGDVLAGVAATFVSWAMADLQKQQRGGDGTSLGEELRTAAAAAALLQRAASLTAFRRAGRAMVAPDVIEALVPEFREMFEPSKTPGQGSSL